MAGTKGASKAAPATVAGNGRARPSNGAAGVDEAALHELLAALLAVKDGNFSVRLPERRTTLIRDENEVRRDGLDPDIHSATARRFGLTHRIFAGGVDGVNVRACHFGERH